MSIYAKEQNKYQSVDKIFELVTDTIDDIKLIEFQNKYINAEFCDNSSKYMILGMLKNPSDNKVYILTKEIPDEVQCDNSHKELRELFEIIK